MKSFHDVMIFLPRARERLEKLGTIIYIGVIPINGDYGLKVLIKENVSIPSSIDGIKVVSKSVGEKAYSREYL
jgi:hypothetical protein